MSPKESSEEIEKENEPEKSKNGRRKKKTDDSKFTELSGDDLETKDTEKDDEPVVYEQKPVQKKAPRTGRKKASAEKPPKRQKSVMELASCPPAVNPKHWKIMQARARRKNEFNQN